MNWATRKSFVFMKKPLFCVPLSLMALACSYALGQSTDTPSVAMPGRPSSQTPPPPLRIVQVPKAGPILLPAPSSLQERSKQPLTAEEAASIALALQPNVTIAKAQADSARATFLQTQAGLLPSVTFVSAYTYASTIAGLGTGTGAVSGNNQGGTNASANPNFLNQMVLRQLLFDFGRTRDTVNESKALANAALTSLTKVQADLVFAVKSQFYATQSAQQLVEVSEADVKSRQDQLDLATASYKAGLGPPVDVVTAQTSLAQSTSALVQAENNFVIAKITLAAEMGIDPRTPIMLAASTEHSVELAPNRNDLQSFVSEALQHRPEVVLAQQTLAAANYGLSSARKGQAPNLSFVASVGAGGAYDPFANDNFSLGLSLNFPLYDGGLTPARIKQASAGLSQSLAELKAASITVISDVAQAYANLQTADQRVKIDAANVSNAQEAVRLAQGQYKAGVTTFIQVTTAQAALVAAQGEQVSALAAQQTARAQFLRALGRPVPGVPGVKVDPKHPVPAPGYPTVPTGQGMKN
jgi:outer membrane protein